MNHIMFRIFNHNFDLGDIKLFLGTAVAGISGGFATIQNFLAQTESWEYKGSLGLCITAIGYLVFELRSQRKAYEDKLDKKEGSVVHNQNMTIDLLRDLKDLNKKQVDWLEDLAKKSLLNKKDD